MVVEGGVVQGVPLDIQLCQVGQAPEWRNVRDLVEKKIQAGQVGQARKGRNVLDVVVGKNQPLEIG